MLFLKRAIRQIISQEKIGIFFWLVDPIDGTKEFINKGDDYTINIALCFNNTPILSFVYAPATKELYFAEKGKGAFKNEKIIKCTNFERKKLEIIVSKSHLNNITKKYIQHITKNKPYDLIRFGSSLKICKLAEGLGDIYPRFGPTMEWDTCAAHLILEESEGLLRSEFNKEIKYNKENLLNPNFIAISNNFYKKHNDNEIFKKS